MMPSILTTRRRALPLLALGALLTACGQTGGASRIAPPEPEPAAAPHHDHDHDDHGHGQPQPTPR